MKVNVTAGSASVTHQWIQFKLCKKFEVSKWDIFFYCKLAVWFVLQSSLYSCGANLWFCNELRAASFSPGGLATGIGSILVPSTPWLDLESSQGLEKKVAIRCTRCDSENHENSTSCTEMIRLRVPYCPDRTLASPQIQKNKRHAQVVTTKVI